MSLENIITYNCLSSHLKSGLLVAFSVTLSSQLWGSQLLLVMAPLRHIKNTLEGAEIFFKCNTGFVPAGRMMTVCRADGRWNPDPATLVCTSETLIFDHWL